MTIGNSGRVKDTFGNGKVGFCLKEISNKELPAAGAVGAAGLYIHIPFCSSKCPYCDFYSITDTSLRKRFLKALNLEMQLTDDFRAAFDSIYIGGGTPSVLTVEDVSRIIESAQQTYTLIPDSEITIEINPGTVTREQLRQYLQASINRINIGVQSFHPENLSFLGRTHSVMESRQAVEWAQTAGFGNIGIDLIYALPNQTSDGWKRDMDAAVVYSPQHLSCYTLTFEPGTPMEKDLREGRIRPLDEQATGDLFLLTADYLTGKGYEHYEVSNYAEESGFRSRHNSKYWSLAPYLGLGPSAHSFVYPERFWNASDVSTYVEDLEAGQLPRGGKETLNRRQMMTEAVLLGLRTAGGMDIRRFDQSFDVRFRDLFAKSLAEFQERKLLELSAERCRLTREGFLLLDAIAASFAENI